MIIQVSSNAAKHKNGDDKQKETTDIILEGT